MSLFFSEYDPRVVFNDMDESQETNCYLSPTGEDSSSGINIAKSKLLAKEMTTIKTFISRRNSFDSTPSVAPTKSVVILNPVVRMTVYKFLPLAIWQTKISALNTRERQLIKAVA